MILTEEQLLIQETARKFAQERLGAELGPVGAGLRVPPRPLQGARRAGLHGHDGAGRVGRGRAPTTSPTRSRWRRSPPATARWPPSSAATTRSASCRSSTTAPRRRRTATCATWRRATSSPPSASPSRRAARTPRAIRTRAVRKGDSYVLNGTKQFITSGKNGRRRDRLRRHRRRRRQARHHRLHRADTKTPGYIVARVENKIGQHASDTCADRVRELPRSRRRTCSARRARATASRSPTWRAGASASPRRASAWRARRSRSRSRYAQERETFGKPIFEHQAVSFRLADMATQLEAARQLTLHAAALKDAGRPCLKEASMAKLFASEMAERDLLATRSRCSAATATSRTSRVERIYRDVRGARSTRAPTTSSASSSAAA